MAASKRKSPKGKRGRQKPSLLLTGAAAVGGLGLQGIGLLGGVIGRNPSITGGTAAFLVRESVSCGCPFERRRN